MSENWEIRDALAGWDPVTHVDPLDPVSISTLRRATLAELERDASRRAVPWLRLAVGAAATLALAFALWSTWGREAFQPRQARGPDAPTPVTPPAPTEPVAPLRAVATPPTSVGARAPAEDRVATATRSADRAGPVRESRLDFRTAGGTRVVWVMRSDFEPPSNRTKSF